jgi:phosphatidate phosphatase LPIN
LSVDQLKKNNHAGGTSTTGSSQGTNWRIWPFPLSRSVSRESSPPIPNDDAKNTANGNSPENKISSDVNKYDTKPPKPNRTKKKIRETTPTSEQIASLNLKEGRNIVTFTFSTAMLGNQQVNNHEFLQFKNLKFTFPFIYVSLIWSY